MQQRRPRLGDILDDYCPRERRITNHVIVAMIDDKVKQTRCTTCDADHEYKQARVPPPRRKKDSLTPPTPIAMPEHNHEETLDETPLVEDVPVEAAAIEGQPDEPVVAQPASENGADAEKREPEDDGPVHRPLIRATLPPSRFSISGAAPRVSAISEYAEMSSAIRKPSRVVCENGEDSSSRAANAAP